MYLKFCGRSPDSCAGGHIGPQETSGTGWGDGPIRGKEASVTLNSPCVSQLLVDDTSFLTVLAHAVIGMAEAVGRRALRESTAEHDPELLAHWTAELVWYGLRGIRTGTEATTTPGAWVES